MEANNHRLLWEQGLRFLGGQTAGQAHEVTNVFNVINELTGLLDDLLVAQAAGRPVDPARLRQIAQKIAHQVQRGETLVRNINLFAHSADNARALFDVREMLERIAFIAARPARLGKTDLSTDFPDANVVLESNPLGFQQAVFVAIEIALQAAQDERQITLSYREVEGGVEITVRSADAFDLDDENRPRMGLLHELLAAMQAELVAPRAACRIHRLVLFFRADPGETGQ